MAPEVIAKKQYGFKCDVFSLGMVICELVTGFYPFDGPNKAAAPSKTTVFETAIVAGLRAPIPKDCHPQLASLISDCWKDAADERPDIDQVMNRLLALQDEYNRNVAAVTAAKAAAAAAGATTTTTTTTTTPPKALPPPPTGALVTPPSALAKAAAAGAVRGPTPATATTGAALYIPPSVGTNALALAASAAAAGAGARVLTSPSTGTKGLVPMTPARAAAVTAAAAGLITTDELLDELPTEIAAHIHADRRALEHELRTEKRMREASDAKLQDLNQKNSVRLNFVSTHVLLC